MPDLPDENDPTNFEKLKALLAPHEADLAIPGGGALEGVTPETDPGNPLPKDLLRVVKLGLGSTAWWEALPLDALREANCFLRDMRNFEDGAGDFHERDPDEDPEYAGWNTFHRLLREIGEGYTGDGYAQIAAGPRRGEVVLLDHEAQDGEDEEAMMATPVDASPGQVLATADGFLVGSGMNLEQCLIELCEAARPAP